jgi:hypothetical protein
MYFESCTQPLRTALVETLDQHNREEVLRKIGYPSAKMEKALERLDALLTSSKLGIESGYDLKYTGLQFLEQLVKALSIDPDLFEKTMSEVFQIEEKLEETCYSQIVRAVTDFVPTPMSRFTYQIAAQRAMIRLPEEDRLLDLEERIERARIAALEHYQQNAGALSLLGEILHYRFYPDATETLIFVPKGDQLEVVAV